MHIVEIIKGPLKGLKGEAVYFADSQEVSVSIPDFRSPLHKEILPREGVKLVDQNDAPILVKKEFTTLQDELRQDVQITGCKVSCSSVWCPECFKRKGASKRIADRLSRLDWRSTRQVVLTVDLKKFSGSGQLAYEILKDSGAINQFIHNLRRTAGVQITDYAWILEWHTDGAPHWHLFIETKKGKQGQIGNENLLKHWKHGLVFESYIKSEKHWKRFTTYFGNNGYFDPKTKCETNRKQHQLELPEWAMEVSYRIRKTGSMVKKSKSPVKEDLEEGYQEEKEEISKKDKEPKPYKEIIGSCGQSTLCQIRRGRGYCVWREIGIPYKEFKHFSGEYIQRAGYQVQMTKAEFFDFLKRYMYAF